MAKVKLQGQIPGWQSYINDTLAHPEKYPKTIHAEIAKFEREKNDPDFEYFFDATKHFDKFVQFTSLLKWKDGLQTGRPIHLEDWEEYTFVQLFGWWYKNEPDRMRFNRVYVEIPRKNGKTILAGLLALDRIVLSKIPNFEGYVVANSENQASKLLRDIKSLIKANPKLRSLFDIQRDFIRMSTKSFDSNFTVLASRAGNLEGLNPDLFVYDEMHVSDTSELYDVMFNSFGAKNNQVFFGITTAGSKMGNWGHEFAEQNRDHIKGKFRDDNLLSLIWCPDKEDDLNDPKTWWKVNPNMGVSIRFDDFKKIYNGAVNGTTRQKNEFYVKRLNQWRRDDDTWLEPDKFEPYFKTIDVESLRGKKAYIGMDLSATRDLTAYTVTIPDGKIFYTLFRIWLPENTIAERVARENIGYEKWVKAKHVSVCKGDVINYDDVFDQLALDCDTYNVEDIALDIRMSGYLVHRIQKELDIEVVNFSQYNRDFHAPTNTFEGEMLKGKFLFDNNLAAKWCFGNAVLDTYKGYIKPVKPHDDTQRIDPLICSIMSTYRALTFDRVAEQPKYFGSITLEL